MCVIFFVSREHVKYEEERVKYLKNNHTLVHIQAKLECFIGMKHFLICHTQVYITHKRCIAK